MEWLIAGKIWRKFSKMSNLLEKSFDSISSIQFLRFSCDPIKQLLLYFSCVLQSSILHLHSYHNYVFFLFLHLFHSTIQNDPLRYHAMPLPAAQHVVAHGSQRHHSCRDRDAARRDGMAGLTAALVSEAAKFPGSPLRPACMVLPRPKREPICSRRHMQIRCWLLLLLAACCYRVGIKETANNTLNGQSGHHTCRRSRDNQRLRAQLPPEAKHRQIHGADSPVAATHQPDCMVD